MTKHNNAGPGIITPGCSYYNDIDTYCCAVLRARIQDGLLPGGYVDERDIRELHASDFVGYQHVHLFAGIGGFPYGLALAGFPTSIRVLTGGFPCQDISNAGKRVGITGERSGLWKQIVRLIQEADDSGMGFDYILLENVAALVNRGLSTVLGDLAEAGYDAEWCVLRASDFGAPHQRERVFIVAYLSRIGSNSRRTKSEKQQWAAYANSNGSSGVNNVAHPHFIGESKQESTLTNGQRSAFESTSVCQRADTAKMAHTTEQGLPRRRQTGFATNSTQATTGMESQLERCSELAYPDFQSLEVGDRCESTRGTCFTTQFDRQGHAQRGLGGMLTRVSGWLDRHRWPAGPGEEQHEWEPERVTQEKQKNRVARLKALGNAIVPQCVEYVARCVMAHHSEVA